jgi:signal transduction histidine kinase
LIKAGKNQLILLINSEIYKNISRNQNVALETFKSPVILLDKDNLILYSNNAAGKMIRNPKDSPGEKIQDLIKDSSLMNVFLKESYKSDYEVTSSDGNSYLVHSSKLQSKENYFIKIYIFTDITQEKKNSADLSEYSALLSHDLRSPMTIIKGYTTMLPIMGQLNDQQRDYVEKIISGVDEMTNLTKNLLDYERLKMGVNLFKQETEIIRLLDKVVDALHPLAVQKRIEVKRDYKDIPEEIVNVDSVLIEQAIYNLIDNAIRFTPIQGKVSIGLGHVDNMVEINIEDAGCGIAAVDIPHIFEKFYRVKISPIYNQAGSGIGLALVKSIVEKHNGEVGAISNLGKGSTFYLRIPKN